MNNKKDYEAMKRQCVQIVEQRIREIKEWVLVNCVTKEEIRQLKAEMSLLRQELEALKKEVERQLQPSLN